MHGDLARLLTGHAATAGPAGAEAPTEPLPRLPADAGPGRAAARRPGWAPWALLAAAGIVAALANLTAVVSAAGQQGLVDQEAAEDLQHQAEEVAKAVQEDPGGRQGQGGGQETGRAGAQSRRAERHRQDPPPATTQVRQAVAELATAVQQAA
jgi:enamine deaminase RidA (YjgF/YER057c/UK114 family)